MSAVVFGAGALGGHTALALAESGVGQLNIIDHDVLLPGNVVRHVVGNDQIGSTKVRAVEREIAKHAPWTKVSVHEEVPVTPNPIKIKALIANADIVVDTTGNEALTHALASVAINMEKPLIAGALYRGGFIGRVQRQASEQDTPILERVESQSYPLIPRGNDSDDFATPELGCSAPINNAPPASVLSCTALIVQAAIDALTKRFELDDEIIDVYRSIPEPPFNRIGRVEREAS